jgi:hypothetical protein
MLYLVYSYEPPIILLDEKKYSDLCFCRDATIIVRYYIMIFLCLIGL